MTEDFYSRVKGVSEMEAQPNAYTCQSTCVAMATGLPESAIMTVRQALEAIGEPGDPATMAKYLTAKLQSKYVYENNASLNQIQSWLKAGEFLIAHGWFTAAGHVVAIDGVENSSSGCRFRIRDPWSEFDFANWSYSESSVGYHGFYSNYGIYAAIVAGQSKEDAASCYSRGELDSSAGGAWVHRIKP